MKIISTFLCRAIGCFCSLCVFIVFISCEKLDKQNTETPIYKDVLFQQEFSKKYEYPTGGAPLQKVYANRNGAVQILSEEAILKTFAGDFLYPGSLVPDKTYRPFADKNISSLTLYRDHFVYADDKAVLSNAWAGKLYARHTLKAPRLLSGGSDFDFLLSDGLALEYIQDSIVAWRGSVPNKVIDIIFDPLHNSFWILQTGSISQFNPATKGLAEVFRGDNFTALALINKNTELVVGTGDGYFILDADSKKQKGEAIRKLPWNQITDIQEINGNLWIGTTRGAMTRIENGKYKYYASKRWIPSDTVVDIAPGPDSSILILTNRGLGQICAKSMTLYEKANYYEGQVRARHLRHGFNATLGYMKDGSLATGSLEDSDNDGLWTSMYLAAQVFRYAVTKSPEVLENIEESMQAMERLYSINQIKGFPSRSFERRGYKYEDKPWRRASHPEWDWKSTTSSDEAIGHIFVFSTMAELLDDQDLKTRAITLIDSLMQHVIDHDMYMVDWNGQPTVWGRWNPEYVNARPKGVGDRKINSSNIIAMLQTAYHFTKKEVYKDKAFELMTKHGYYENLMFPMERVGKARDDADDWSKMLSESWNHSDDEMYFLGYWGLYRYAFNDTLKVAFKESIIDHWKVERPEKEGAWNIFTALTGTPEFDLNEAAWYLREYPMDLIHWRVTNSHRKDIEFIEENFRKQTIKTVLPAGELPVSRHNANRFDLDGGDGGTSEYSAGDIWLLPYWMGRYLGVISAPVRE